LGRSASELSKCFVHVFVGVRSWELRYIFYISRISRERSLAEMCALHFGGSASERPFFLVEKVQICKIINAYMKYDDMYIFQRSPPPRIVNLIRVCMFL